jgi:hypothetical protein
MHVTRKRGTCPTKPDQRRRHRSRGSLHLTFKYLRNPFCHSAEMQGCIAIFKLFPRSLYTARAQSRDVQFLRTWIATSTPRAHDPALSLIAHHPRTRRISQNARTNVPPTSAAKSRIFTHTSSSKDLLHLIDDSLYIQYIFSWFLCSARICTNSFLAFYQK